MNPENISEILPLISTIISCASVVVAVFAVQEARKTALASTYFSEMTKAYSEYLRCVSGFALRRGVNERDALAASLYRLQLFAPKEICKDAQELYAFLLAWASSNPSGALEIDARLAHLGLEMREHLAQSGKIGRL